MLKPGFDLPKEVAFDSDLDCDGVKNQNSGKLSTAQGNSRLLPCAYGNCILAPGY
jgi:hypothetical protein